MALNLQHMLHIVFLLRSRGVEISTHKIEESHKCSNKSDTKHDSIGQINFIKTEQNEHKKQAQKQE